MILRKLADAIREQNWSTVILEILIVVVGIFIGLQVDGWNEGRIKQQDIEVQLLRIADDAAVLLAETDLLMVDFDNRIARAQIALEVLDGTPLTEANTPVFERALAESFQLNEVEVDLPSLDILMNTGDIDQVADVVRPGDGPIAKIREISHARRPDRVPNHATHSQTHESPNNSAPTPGSSTRFPFSGSQSRDRISYPSALP